jgi:hypothetical protein
MSELIYIGFGLAALFFVLIVVLFILYGSLRKKYLRFMKGLGQVDVESLMQTYAAELSNLREHVQEKTEPRIDVLEKKMPTTLRNVGIVSYNAFEHMGNMMSFSVAALDDNTNGVVLTGIYSRDSSYVYAKGIRSGTPDKELSKEEKEAYRKAVENGHLVSE